MKALVAYPPNRGSVVLEERPIPSPGPGQALLSVVRVGIDGTDMEIGEGVYGAPPEGERGLIIGHEALARVEEVGGGVTNVKAGDLVVPTVRRPCPENCINCRSGEMDRCRTGHYREHGIHMLHGFAAEKGLTDAKYLVKAPEGELDDAIVMAEPLSVVENAVDEVFRVQRRMRWEPKNALVVGVGAIGLLTTMVLRLRGLEVIAMATGDKDNPKAQAVQRVGGRYISTREVPISQLDERFDIIIEATGAAGPAVSALQRLDRNGAMCLLGIYREQAICEEMGKVLSNMVLQEQMLFGSVSAKKEHFEQGIGDMRRMEEEWPGALPSLITQRVRMEEFQKALAPPHDNIKTVIEIGGR